MNRSILGVTTLAICLGAFFLVPTAFAYAGTLGQAGGTTLEEQLILAERKVEVIEETASPLLTALTTPV